MNRGTVIMVAFAAVTLGGALWMAPSELPPAAFEDTGEPLFSDFTDSGGATSLEVVNWSEDSAKVTRFKVEQKAGRWLIPSHHDYPADAAERMGKAAASFIDVKRDIYYGDKLDDHARFGLLDPEGTAGKGDDKATRFTLKQASGATLVDIFVGRQVPDKDGFHYVRLPDSKRVYGSRLELDISTSFTDWIEKDLLQIDRADVVTLIYDPYRVDENRRKVIDSHPIRVDREGGASGTWTLAGTPPRKQKLDESKFGQIVNAIDQLQIVGVRPRPIPLTLAALQSKGFFVTPDGKKLYGNEGEIRAVTEDGIVYRLYFGEVTLEAGLALTAGKTNSTRTGSSDGDAGVSEKTDPADNASANRYLFVDVGYDPALDRNAKRTETDVGADAGPAKPPAAAPVDPDKQAEHTKRAAALQERFAPWFFVISDSSFKKIHKQRDDLFKEE